MERYGVRFKGYRYKMTAAENGEFVRYAGVASLEAEVARMRRFLEALSQMDVGHPMIEVLADRAKEVLAGKD